MVWFSFAVMLLLWIIDHWPHMNPNIPADVAINAPPDIVAAAKATAATMEKWGHVADMVLTWNVPISLLIGAALLCCVVALWRGSGK
jgi:hypothetical protein